MCLRSGRAGSLGARSLAGTLLLHALQESVQGRDWPFCCRLLWNVLSFCSLGGFLGDTAEFGLL